MANLTESMTGLRNEIIGLRQNRDALRTELRRVVSDRRTSVLAWRSTLIDDMAGARRAWAGLSAKATVQEPAKTKAPPAAAAKPVSTTAPEPAAKVHVAEVPVAKPVAAEAPESKKAHSAEAPIHTAAAEHPAAEQQHTSSGHSGGHSDGGKRHRDRH